MKSLFPFLFIVILLSCSAPIISTDTGRIDKLIAHAESKGDTATVKILKAEKAEKIKIAETLTEKTDDSNTLKGIKYSAIGLCILLALAIVIKKLLF